MKKLVLLVCVTAVITSTVVFLAGCLNSKQSGDIQPNSSSAPKAAKPESLSSKNSFEWYFNLIGLNKEKLITALNETPISIDEGGLEFKKANIRVWFKDFNQKLTVDQIWTQRSDIDFSGAKIGDNISSFKKAFGETVSDKNNDAHFKYKGMFLSVGYEPQTQKTTGAYFLKNDF